MIFGTGSIQLPEDVHKWSVKLPTEGIAVAVEQNEDGSVEVEMTLVDGRDLLLGISTDGTFELSIFNRDGSYTDIPVEIPPAETSGGNQSIIQDLSEKKGSRGD